MASEEVIPVANPDVDKLSVRELREFLRDRGEYVSGKRQELVERAHGLSKLGRKTLRQIQEADNAETATRAVEIFRTPQGEKIPEPWTLTGSWDDKLMQIPPFRPEDVYNYLVLSRTRTFDSDCMNAKKQLKAKVFYEDRHVHSVRYHEISKGCTHCYVKARVIPSLPTDTKKKDYETWACLSKVTGKVHATGCQCVAGEGESCNHIAALLYAVVDIAEKHKSGLNAQTSSQCKWNRPRKRKLSPKKSQHLVFKKIKFEDSSDAIKSVKQKPDRLQNVKPLDLCKFRSKLKQCAPHAALLLSESSFIQKKEMLPSLHKIDFMFSDIVDLKSDICKKFFADYFESLKFDPDDCALVEKLTRGQSKSELWRESRIGRLTSSNFGLVFRKREDTKPDNILKTVMCYESFDCAATRWGRTHEPAGRRVYVRESQSLHPGLTVSSSGLITSAEHPFLGTSPDGLVDCCQNCTDQKGLLEVKCPYKFREVSPEHACNDKTFCCEILDAEIKLKRNHPYYYQVQGQMGVTERRWCDFFVWTLKGHSTERIYFDAEIWSEMLTKLNYFYKTAVLPELFSERVKRGEALF